MVGISAYVSPFGSDLPKKFDLAKIGGAACVRPPAHRIFILPFSFRPLFEIVEHSLNLFENSGL